MSLRRIVLLGLAALAGGALAVPHAPASPDPARLQVTAHEFTFALSRSLVRSGHAIVQLVNLGEDDHDLAIRRLRPGAPTRRTAIAGPGAVRELVLRLEPGRYALWCTLADHRSRGMSAVIRVRRR